MGSDVFPVAKHHAPFLAIGEAFVMDADGRAARRLLHRDLKRRVMRPVVRMPGESQLRAFGVGTHLADHAIRRLVGLALRVREGGFTQPQREPFADEECPDDLARGGNGLANSDFPAGILGLSRGVGHMPLSFVVMPSTLP